MIKVLLWDIDGTILDFLPAEKAAIKSCFRKFCLQECTDEMITVYSGINKRYWKALENKEMTKPEILTGRFREFFGLYGIDPSIAEAFNSEYQMRLGDTICFCRNARETIEVLQGKVVQCAVTNGTKIAQDKKISRSGLDQLLDFIFISEEVGFEKPDLRFFEKVFSVIGEYDPSEIMIIGDSVNSDMRGGNNAGITTCYYNPAHDEKPEDLRIDYMTDDLSKIPVFLGLD